MIPTSRSEKYISLSLPGRILTVVCPVNVILKDIGKDSLGITCSFTNHCNRRHFQSWW